MMPRYIALKMLKYAQPEEVTEFITLVESYQALLNLDHSEYSSLASIYLEHYDAFDSEAIARVKVALEFLSGSNFKE